MIWSIRIQGNTSFPWHYFCVSRMFNCQLLSIFLNYQTNEESSFKMKIKTTAFCYLYIILKSKWFPWQLTNVLPSLIYSEHCVDITFLFGKALLNHTLIALIWFFCITIIQLRNKHSVLGVSAGIESNFPPWIFLVHEVRDIH